MRSGTAEYQPFVIKTQNEKKKNENNPRQYVKNKRQRLIRNTQTISDEYKPSTTQLDVEPEA